MMDEAQVHQIIEANNGVLLKQMSDLISAQVASLKRPAKDFQEKDQDLPKIFHEKDQDQDSRRLSGL